MVKARNSVVNAWIISDLRCYKRALRFRSDI